MKKFLFKYSTYIFLAAFVVFPVAAFAQGNVTVNYNASNTTQSGCSTNINSISALFDLAICILRNSVWPLLIALAVIVFVVGVIKYISGADDSTKRTEGRNFMIYGIVALFVMISVWGLVAVLQGTFGLGNTPFIPQLQEPN